MDFPIEMNFTNENKSDNKSNNKSNNKSENKKNNNLYYRYYICIQKIENVECIKCENHERVEEISKKNKLFLTEYNKNEHTNVLFPIKNEVSVSFKICKFIPSFFDSLILRIKLNNLLIIKKTSDFIK